jgi:hypothetical protein
VCSRWSSQYPSQAGTSISSEIAVIREVHSIAATKGERSSHCFDTGGQLSGCAKSGRIDNLLLPPGNVNASRDIAAQASRLCLTHVWT